MTELHLLVPGLFGPGKGLGISAYPRLPALERFLSRAATEQFEGMDLDATLCRLFQVAPPSGRDLPTGTIARYGLRGNADGVWAQASPVYLRPDQSRLLLFDADSLDIQPEEAQSLVELFNGHFAAEGYRVEAASLSEWFLSLPCDLEVTTHSLNEVVGFNMDLFMAAGADARRWRSLLNETQMLFHHAEVNAERERRGQPAVSGLWFHGFGRLPKVRCEGFILRDTDYPLARGLAALAGKGDSPPGELSLRRDLVRAVLDADGHAWLAGLAAIEKAVAQVNESIREGVAKVCYLYPCDGRRLRLDRNGLRKFWSRSKPLSQWIGS